MQQIFHKSNLMSFHLNVFNSFVAKLPSLLGHFATGKLAPCLCTPWRVSASVPLHKPIGTLVALECNTETIKVPRSWIQWSLSVPFKKGQLAHHKFLQPGRPTSVPWTNPKPSQHKISFMGARPPPKADWGPDQIPATKVARSILAEGNRTGTGEWVDVYKFCYRHYRNWANSCVQMHMHVARCDQPRACTAW